MTDRYINSVNRRKSRREAIDYYFFGFGFGTILLVASFLGWITNKYLSIDFIYIVGMVVAGLIICLTPLSPELQKLFQLLFRKIGTAIFVVLLSVIYFVFFWPFGAIRNRRSKNNKAKTDSSFVSHVDSSSVSSSHKTIHALHIIRFFVNERSAYIIPLLIVLILLGALLAFAQTSIVAPLIYVFF